MKVLGGCTWKPIWIQPKISHHDFTLESDCTLPPTQAAATDGLSYLHQLNAFYMLLLSQGPLNAFTLLFSPCTEPKGLLSSLRLLPPGTDRLPKNDRLDYPANGSLDGIPTYRSRRQRKKDNETSSVKIVHR